MWKFAETFYSFGWRRKTGSVHCGHAYPILAVLRLPKVTRKYQLNALYPESNWKREAIFHIILDNSERVYLIWPAVSVCDEPCLFGNGNRLNAYKRVWFWKRTLRWFSAWSFFLGRLKNLHFKRCHRCVCSTCTPADAVQMFRTTTELQRR